MCYFVQTGSLALTRKSTFIGHQVQQNAYAGVLGDLFSFTFLFQGASGAVVVVVVVQFLVPTSYLVSSLAFLGMLCLSGFDGVVECPWASLLLGAESQKRLCGSAV
eukprot:5908750-Amphidinium_carterae.1